jgi:hypothetical protein
METDDELDRFDAVCVAALRVVEKLAQYPQKKRERHQDRAEAQAEEKTNERNGEHIDDELHVNPLV